MEILGIIYQIIIGPLELLFEFVFSVSYKLIRDPGICIIILSIVMNLLALPLYRRADALQKEASDKQKKVQPWQDKIRKTFKGDERFMMLQAYNREKEVRPTDVLKGSMSLLLEIPFFIAAYRMLSGLALLNGKTFGPLKDLGSPDGLLVIGTVAVNVLPVLMTVINLISSSIYLKGSDIKGKIQLYGIAAIFLVLLYNSPSGLVFYWTCNNIFSLIKNLIPFDRIKMKEKKRSSDKPSLKNTFILCGIYNTVFVGLLVPSIVIKSSTAEFVNMYSMRSPAVYLLWSFASSAGFFLLWAGVMYFIFTPGARRVLAMISAVSTVIFTLDLVIFGREYGVMSSALYYYNLTMDYRDYLLIGFTLVILVSVLMVMFRKYILKAMPFVAAAGILSVLVCGLANVISISDNYNELSYLKDQLDYAKITLSKDKQNVVVVMLDRAVGVFVPYCFNERPELKEQFDGFVFYENTISFGAHTNTAAPALYGGYEYTPANMNLRDGESIPDKHDEALKVLPVLFSDNGFDVTLCDPSYAGYEEIPDLSVFEGYQGIDAYITNGRYNPMKEEEDQDLTSLWKRNFFCYSLMRVMPPFLHELLYDNGHYNIPDFYNEFRFVPLFTGSGNQSKGYAPEFMDSYSVLEALPEMTEISSSGNGSYTLLVNYTAHSEAILKEPEYEPEFFVDNTEYDSENIDRFEGLNVTQYWQLASYQDSMASYILLGKWFDDLREQGVYDNTRIIIVADHGYGLNVISDYDDAEVSPDFYNPVLFVKDFDSQGFSISDEFMTNADVPFLAVEGLIEDPVNPFTSEPVTNDYKNDLPLYIFGSHDTSITANNGNTFNPGPWYKVDGDVLDINSWEYAGEW
ncbi:MAG: YidC/Oxa1 family membrane protein insertase [Clostridiales bacterium]|nr:YidC/Oxa1 family membrane protein insertase [Clostridiales bacterium]